MTDLQLQQHRDRLAWIHREYWRQDESNSEHAERAEKAEVAAGWYFDLATMAQKAAYSNATAGLYGLWAPCHNRAREAAKVTWYASTAEARALYETTFEELMRDGEVTEATSYAWDALCAKAKTAEAA